MKKVLTFLLLYFVSTFPIIAQNKSGNYIAKYAKSIKSVAWSSDGTYYAACGDNFVVLWRAADNTVAKLYTGKTPEKNIEAGYRNEASESEDTSISESGSEESFVSVSFSENSKWLLGIRTDGTAFVWNLESDFRIDEINLDFAIDDAVFLGNGYRMAMLSGGNVLYEWFKLMETNTMLVDKRVEFPSNVRYLSFSDNEKKLLTVFEDGSVALVSTQDWSITKPFSFQFSLDVPPRFSRDGKHFLGKISKTVLCVSSINSEEKNVNIYDEDAFLDSAVFSADSKKVIAGTQMSIVKVYDIENGGKVENVLRLASSDRASCIDSSPDGDIIVGTEQGYLIRMRKDGKVYSQRARKYISQSKMWSGSEKGAAFENVAETDGFARKSGNRLDVCILYTTLPEDYFVGSCGIESEYKNKTNLPRFLDNIDGVYWGLCAQLQAGIPEDDFPYNYSEKGTNLNPPYLYAISFLPSAGYEKNIKDTDFVLFFDVRGGTNIRVLYNNSIKHGNRGRFYPGLALEVHAGVRWQQLVFSAGTFLDSNLGLLAKVSAGVSVRL